MRLGIRHVWIAMLAIIVALILAAFFAVSSVAAPEHATSWHLATLLSSIRF